MPGDRHVVQLVGMPDGNGYRMLALPHQPDVGLIGMGATGAAVADVQTPAHRYGLLAARRERRVRRRTCNRRSGRSRRRTACPRTGVVDAATQAKFRTATRARARSTSGTLIEIDKTRQILMVVHERRRALHVQRLDRFGSPVRPRRQGYSAHTPEGMFSIIRQVDGPDHGPLGTLWRPKYFTWSGIAVHGYAVGAAVSRVARLYAGLERRHELDLGEQHPADRLDGLGVRLNGRLSPVVEAVDGGVVVHVHVLARSGRTEIVGLHGDALKVRVAAPPVDGRATEAVRVALADALGVAPATVSVISGERSRLKRLRIEGLAAPEAQRRLARWIGEGTDSAAG